VKTIFFVIALAIILAVGFFIDGTLTVFASSQEVHDLENMRFGMDTNVVIFLAAQAFAIIVFLVGTYVKTAVRLKTIELHLIHGEATSLNNHKEIESLKVVVNGIRLKLEHMEVMQTMLCVNCPLKHHDKPKPGSRVSPSKP
jgi:hypothetical protein